MGTDLDRIVAVIADDMRLSFREMALASGEWSDGDLDDDAAREDFDARILEARCVVKMDMRSGTLQHVELLMTFGGPNVWVDVDPDGGAFTVRGYWAGDAATASGVASDDVRAWCRYYADVVSETSGAF